MRISIEIRGFYYSGILMWIAKWLVMQFQGPLKIMEALYSFVSSL